MSTKYVVNISPTAQADVRDIWLYISADSPEAAEKFMDALDHQLQTLQSFPTRCTLIQENQHLATDYRHLIFGKYRTIFRIDQEADVVEVLRIIHGARSLEPADMPPM